MDTASQQSTIQDDFLYHIEQIVVDLERLRIDNNRNPAIVFCAQNLIAKLFLITDLYQRNDKPAFRALKNKVNQLISDNPNVKGVIVHIENSRSSEISQSIQKFKITI